MHPSLQRGEALADDRYAWIITHDLLADDESDVGVCGPRGATPDEIAKANGFKMNRRDHRAAFEAKRTPPDLIAVSEAEARETSSMATMWAR